MIQAKKLIEVAMPIKEISAESVRDKSIRHGHISTLHLWWARRPLPVCRAVVFASLVPDPLDENCPRAFRDAVQLLLGTPFALHAGSSTVDWYLPYDDIPWTAIFDPMEDNLRNRLQMFIGKFSRPMQDYLLGKAAKPGAKDQLSDASLIKWDNKNDEAIIGKARQLIWVAHNATNATTAEDLLKDFDHHYQAIKTAENELYSIPDRHLATEEVKTKETALQQAIDAFQDKMPKVFDPFAGGGAIPLEAARLGCKTYGNDINPVAHIIQKGSLEFPQKYGKPITYSKDEFTQLYGEETFKTISNDWKVFTAGNVTGVRIPNRLSFDVAFYAKKLLAETEREIGHLYIENTKGEKPLAYYWARTAKCSNPSCKAQIPLLRQFYLCKKKDKQIYLDPVINGNSIEFKISQGVCNRSGFVQNRKTLICPCCGSTTTNAELKVQFNSGKVKERLLAIIEEKKGKSYRLPSKEDLGIENFRSSKDRPKDQLPIKNTKQFDTCSWGFDTYGSLFSNRQLESVWSFVNNLKTLSTSLSTEEPEYTKAIETYLAIWVDRIVQKGVSFLVWDTGYEKISNLFGRQALAMVFDYVESNPFCGSTGSALNQLDWILRYIEGESHIQFPAVLLNSSSGEKGQFLAKEIDVVVTDPPYYDAIAYADLSDFFYVWLKKTLGHLYPLIFATPLSPKSEECTALKYYHDNSLEKAKYHFEHKLTQIFETIEIQTKDLVCIMFAHQSTEAWTTLCNSILASKMNITGSWATDSEYTNTGLKANKSFLSSSVTVSAKPSQKQQYGEYKEVKKAIEATVAKEVEELYRLGFRGADLLTACFGKAVSEFGKYEKVEKADGSEVTVAELLEMARESAFNALLKGFDGDDFTKFYIAWLQLYGFVESDFDDAAKFSRVGLSINVQELFTDYILLKNGNKQALGGFAERLAASKNLGEKANSHLIDQVHRAMHLYQGANRGVLLEYIHRVASSADSSFWRVLTSLCEILPGGSDDHKQAVGLIANKESLIRESQTAQKDKASQTKLFE